MSACRSAIQKDGVQIIYTSRLINGGDQQRKGKVGVLETVDRRIKNDSSKPTAKKSDENRVWKELNMPLILEEDSIDYNEEITFKANLYFFIQWNRIYTIKNRVNYVINIWTTFSTHTLFHKLNCSSINKTESDL